jgi:hypothetical protein
MPLPTLDRRWLIILGLALLVTAALAVAGGAGALYRWYAPQEFPGSTMTSDSSFVRPGTYPSLRRDTSYQSSAPFNEVYKWYSITFGLGPEQYGTGACILMAHSNTVLRVFENDVGVTVCDTPFGQKILVSRSLTLRVR